MGRYIAALVLAVLIPWPCVWAANVSDFLDFSLRASNNSLLLAGRLYVPPVAATSARPLILFMHGAGEVGTNNTSQVNGNIDNLLNEAKLRGAYLLAPQTYTSWADTNITSLTATMIDRALTSQHVDVNRIYVTGLSLGGGGVWNMLNRYPERFAASVPIAGVAPASDFVSSRLVNEPIWAFHARDDATVSVTASRNVVSNILRAASKPVPTYPALSDRTTTFQLDTSSIDYTEWPTGGHGIWPAVYSNPPMYNWMFAHSSSPVPNSFLLTPAVGGNFYQWNTGFVSPNDAQIAARVVGPNLAIGATPFANGAIAGFPATNINNGLADGSDTWMGVDDTIDDFVALALSHELTHS